MPPPPISWAAGGTTFPTSPSMCACVLRTCRRRQYSTDFYQLLVIFLVKMNTDISKSVCVGVPTYKLVGLSQTAAVRSTRQWACEDRCGRVCESRIGNVM